jgi:hypothetical protein
MTPKAKLALWELGCVLWVCFAGSLLHFAFELSEYWQPMALIAAVNESAWEHTKMYFWPGLVYALVQYTYTRHLHNNYLQGKAAALALTPVAIFALYYSYLGYVQMTGGKANLATMLSIMLLGISFGQAVSYRILTAAPFSTETRRYAGLMCAILLIAYSAFTYFPPRLFVFENFYCYRYTKEFGILDDYEPYRIFSRVGDDSSARVNYCNATAEG